MALIDFHCLDTRVEFGGECVENKIRVLVDTNEVTRFELLSRDKTNEREEDGLSCRCLDDGALAFAHRIQITICTILLAFWVDI